MVQGLLTTRRPHPPKKKTLLFHSKQPRCLSTPNKRNNTCPVRSCTGALRPHISKTTPTLYGAAQGSCVLQLFRGQRRTHSRRRPCPAGDTGVGLSAACVPEIRCKGVTASVLATSISQLVHLPLIFLPLEYFPLAFLPLNSFHEHFFHLHIFHLRIFH